MATAGLVKRMGGLQPRDRLVMFLVFIGIAQIPHLAPPVMNHQILYGMGLSLATVVRLAVGFIVRPIDPTLGTIDDEL
jgi:hypothetical protein